MSAEYEPSIQRAKYISELVFLSKPLIQASYQKKKTKPTKISYKLAGLSKLKQKPLRSVVDHKTLVKAHLPCWSRSLALGLKNKETARAPDSEHYDGSAAGKPFPFLPNSEPQGSHQQRSRKERGSLRYLRESSGKAAGKGRHEGNSLRTRENHGGSPRFPHTSASKAPPDRSPFTSSAQTVTGWLQSPERNNVSDCNLYVNNTM